MDSQILIGDECDLVVPNEVELVHARRDLEEPQYLVNLTFRRVVEEVQRAGQDSHTVALEAQLAAALKVPIDVLHVWIVIETLMKMRDQRHPLLLALTRELVGIQQQRKDRREGRCYGDDVSCAHLNALRRP